jgi:integrase
MPKRAAGLTSRKVETERRPGRHADGHGLYLVVKPSGMKSWSLLYTIAGRRREKGLGGFPAVSLATARKLALKNRETLAAGRDPLEEADRKPVPTFGALADEYIRTHSLAWRNEKHRAQWMMTLEHYAKPLRAKRVNEIQVADVLGVLEPIWTTRPETASRLRGRIEAVLDAAKARGYRNGENPAAWRCNLRHLLPGRVRLPRGHHPALPFTELPDFLNDLQRQPGTAARALEFIILTGSRSGEALGARWGEFDLDFAVWIIPAQRMKGGREHRVPLSMAALEVLRNMARLRRSSEPDAFVFPGARDEQPLSGMSTAMVLRRMGREKVTTHGFRSSFRDWAAECTTFPREIAEAALAHRVGNAVEQAYRRGDALEKRRELMNEWATYLAPALVHLDSRIQPSGRPGEISHGAVITH